MRESLSDAMEARPRQSAGPPPARSGTPAVHLPHPPADLASSDTSVNAGAACLTKVSMPHILSLPAVPFDAFPCHLIYARLITSPSYSFASPNYLPTGISPF
jgi:hypothetical protein